jgi:4-hydroxy-3-polyprenylbenzoate decarboxylase
MYRSLGEFVAALESQGELARIRVPVSPILEIAEIADRESKSPAPKPPSESARRNDPRFHNRGGRALLFESVEGADHPVLINALGSYRRMEMALGCHDEGHTPGGFDAIGARIADLTKPEPPKSFGELIDAAKKFGPLIRIPPRTVRRAACQEVVLTGDEVDLTRLPILRCWPHDGDLAAVGYPADVNDDIRGVAFARDEAQRGRYITFAGIHTIHADDAGKKKPGSHNIGMYRVQMFGPRHVAMHWHLHHDGARHWRSWRKRGERMPVAIALGGQSVLPFSAIAPLPPGISELLMAGFLNRRGVAMVPCKTVPLRAPADAEIVLEGWVSHEAGPPGYDPREDSHGPLGPGAVFEGPFGDHTGFYSLPDRYPLVEITAVTMRRNAIYPTTIVGLPPQEDYPMGKAVERLFLPLLKTIVHDVEDYDLPLFGAFHNCAIVKIHKEYALQGRRLMASIWGAGQMAWTKLLFVVDDLDPHDTFRALAEVGRRCDPATDVTIQYGPLDILDHAAPAMGAGGKLGFDATRRFPGEAEAIGESPAAPLRGMSDAEADAWLAQVSRCEGVAEAALPEQLGRAWLLLRVRTSADDPTAGRRALEAAMSVEHAQAPRFAIALGPDIDLADLDSALFHWCANFDPARDTVRTRGRMGFDATPKRNGWRLNGRPARDWPPVIAMDDATKELVDRRWGEYGLG